MSKAFLAAVIQGRTVCTDVANQATTALVPAIVRQMKRDGGVTLPSFGRFRVAGRKARKALNPGTGESMKLNAGKTVRFRAGPTLKAAV